MFKKLKVLIQKLKCAAPFSPYHFWHDRLVVVKQLSQYCQLVQCESCGKKFGINHSCEIILPWENLKPHYEEFHRLFGDYKPTRHQCGFDHTDCDYIERLEQITDLAAQYLKFKDAYTYTTLEKLIPNPKEWRSEVDRYESKRDKAESALRAALEKLKEK